MGAECCKATGNTGTMNLYSEFVNDPDLKTSISQATNLLRKAQTIKNTLKSCQEKTKKLTTLPLHNALAFLQNLQVLLWTLSASHHGKIQQANFVISSASPFLDLNSVPINNETYELLECLRLYLDTITSEAQTMKEITEDLYALRRELNKWEQLRGIQNDKEEDMATSYKKLADEMKGIEDIEESLREAHAKLPWIMEKAHSLLATADEVGFQAEREGIYDLKRLVNRFKICLETGQEKKKWVMRVSTQLEEGVMKARDSNVQHIQRGRANGSKETDNKDIMSQYHSVTFRSDYSSMKTISKDKQDPSSDFQNGKQSNVGDLKIFDFENKQMKQSNVTYRVKADDLNNKRKTAQLGSQENNFISKSSDIRADNKNVSGTRVQGVGKLDFTKIKDKINRSDLYKGIAVINENLDEEDDLSISAVQNSDRNKIARGEW